MERVVLLNSNAFPSLFNKIVDVELVGEELQNFTENKIIQVLNQSNPKINVKSIEYVDFNNISFHNFPSKESKFLGVIVDNQIINEKYYKEIKSKIEKENEEYIHENQGEFFYRKIRSYVFLSHPNSDGRNTKFSQTIFPTTLIYMNEFLNSPMYSIFNHPAYCINLFNGKLTQNSILKQIYGFSILGVKFLDLFSNIDKTKKFQINTLNEYLEVVTNDDEKQGSSWYENQYVIVNNSTKYLQVKYPFETMIKVNDRKYDIHGSNEKFYLMGILPPLLFAMNENYTVDISNIKEFYMDYYETGLIKTKKMERFKYIIDYVDKLEK